MEKAAIASITSIVFARMLTFWFTGWDTFSLIYTARVSSVVDIFTKPLMFATGFVGDASYFRPVIALLFWLEYRLFGLHPTGYFATNLMFHVLSVILIMLVAHKLHGRMAGMIAGTIFAFHPLVLENVPVISRGQDVVATVFILLTVYLFLTRRFGWGAVAYALALLSKELGILAFPMAAAVLWWQRDNWREIIPLVGVTGAYFIWHWAVLGGLGGYVGAIRSKLGLLLGVLAFYPGYVLTPWNTDQVVDSLRELLPIFAVGATLFCAVMKLRHNRTVILTGLYLLLPIGLFSAGALRYWYFYLPAAMVALFLSILILELREQRQWVALAPVVLLAVLLVAANRPALTTWEAVGRVNKQMLARMEAVVQELDPGETVYCIRALSRVRNRPGDIRGVNFLQDHSVQSYLKLRETDNNVIVRFATGVELSAIPKQIDANYIDDRYHVVKWEYDADVLDTGLYDSWMMR